MKKVLSIIFLLSTIISLSAQDITSVFLSAPDNLIFGLDAEAKDKLIANRNDTSTIEVPSSLGGKVQRIGMSDDFIEVRTSSAGTIQMKLLPLVNNTYIVSVVTTVCGKACDSKINFYTTDWKPLSNSATLFPKLNSDMFIKSGTNRTEENFINAFAALDMTPMKIELNGNDTSAKVYLDIESYLTKTDYDKIKPYLTDEPKVFNWDKTSFK